MYTAHEIEFCSQFRGEAESHPSLHSLLKKGTGSERNTIIPVENSMTRRACPFFTGC